PEIRWRLRAEQLHEFHELQVRLLRNAMANLTPGGQLVYSTCSMEPEENEEVVAEALGDDRSIRRVAAKVLAQRLQPYLANESGAEALFIRDGYFRTSPSEQGTDGFFAAVLERA